MSMVHRMITIPVFGGGCNPCEDEMASAETYLEKGVSTANASPFIPK
jgi:hypothetical protein